jgi:hypothetical protein
LRQSPKGRPVDPNRGEVERPGGTGGVDLREEIFDVHPAMIGRIRTKAPRGLLELTLHPDAPAAARLVPGDRYVHEALQEVALLGCRRPPGLLELLVRREVLAGPDQLETAVKP